MYSTIPWHVPFNAVRHPAQHFYDRHFGYPKFIVSLSTDESEASFARYIAKDLTQIFHIDMNAGSDVQYSNILECLRNYVTHMERILDRDHPIALLFEIRNKKLRTGGIKHREDVYLDQNQRIVLTNHQKYLKCGTNSVLYVNFHNKHLGSIVVGSHILVSDGNIRLRVLQVDSYEKDGLIYNAICCISETDGLLKAGLDVQFPSSNSNEVVDSYMFTPTRERSDDIEFALMNGAHFLVVLYENSESFFICEYIRWALNVRSTRALLITKIPIKMIGQLTEAVVSKIFSHYSGIWIKSDLVYTNREKSLTKKLMKRAIDLDKMIIWEGPLLDDPETYFYPDCICIRPGDDPTALKRDIKRKAPFLNRQSLTYACAQRIDKDTPMIFLLTNGAIIASIINRAACIISVSSAGKSVSLLATQRPVVPIVAVSKSRRTSRRLLIYKNIRPIYYSKNLLSNWEAEISARVNFGLAYARHMNFLSAERPTVVIVFDSMQGFLFADTYRVFNMNRDGRYYIQL